MYKSLHNLHYKQNTRLFNKRVRESRRRKKPRKFEEFTRKKEDNV